jgi:multiple sugar transport system permease protein
MKKHFLGYGLITPVLVIVVLALGLPLANSLWISFQNQRLIGGDSEFVGLETYVFILKDPGFWSALGRSGTWVLANLVIQTMLAFATALLLESKGWWASSARVWVVLPWVIPTISAVIIWQWLLNSNYGVVHWAMGEIGIDLGSPFSDPGVVLLSIILINSWHWFPLSAVVIYGALATVPKETLEAAKIDGAKSWQSFFFVTLPIINPILFALGLVGSLWSFNVLDSIYLITEGGPVDASTTMPVYIYNAAFGAFRSSEAAAASVLTVLILVIAASFFVRFARPKENY